jgi:hypothetical protein
MNKFKAVLAADHVTAPNHFHGLVWEEDAGVFELMAYEYKVFRKEHFPSRTALIDAFKAGGFMMLNNQPAPAPRQVPVPPERWTGWVPKKKYKKKLVTPLTLKLGQTVGGHKTITADREYRVQVMDKKHAFTVELPGLSPFPAQSAWETKVFDYVRSLPDFASNYGFPFYERWGYGTVDQFLAGLKWKFRRGKKSEANTLFGAGTRVEYTILHGRPAFPTQGRALRPPSSWSWRPTHGAGATGTSRSARCRACGRQSRCSGPVGLPRRAA